MKALARLLSALLVACACQAQDSLEWSRLPPLPDKHGFAGSFSGVCDGSLIVAGGANFPDKMPWEGGSKVWHRRVFRLEHPGAEWKIVGNLPYPLGYGASVTTDQGLLCIGGSQSTRHRSEVMLLTCEDRLDIRPMPPLPTPLANLAAGLIGRRVYAVGGIDHPDATTALHAMWSLDLDKAEAGWRTEPPWPGRGRMFAACGSAEGALFLVGGADLQPGANGKPERVWLKDAYRFTPGQGWQRLADAPEVSVAAPSPMPSHGGALLLLGGDDGRQVQTPPLEHQGFPKNIFRYDIKQDRWTPAGRLPMALVTTPTVRWNGQWVIPGGEVRPGVRSAEVWRVRLSD